MSLGGMFLKCTGKGVQDDYLAMLSLPPPPPICTLPSLHLLLIVISTKCGTCSFTSTLFRPPSFPCSPPVGLESFSFSYTVDWPVSLVINRKSLTRYELLFRHLFYCKRTEKQFYTAWKFNIPVTTQVGSAYRISISELLSMIQKCPPQCSVGK